MMRKLETELSRNLDPSTVCDLLNVKVTMIVLVTITNI